MPETNTDNKNDNKSDNASGNAQGGRGIVDNALSFAPQAPGVTGGNNKEGNKTKDGDEGFGLDNKDVKGSLKIHIKLDLEADIRVIARIKGDIAIGLL